MTKIKGKLIPHWESKVVDHGSYKDLGHYVIDMGEIDQEEFVKGAIIANQRVDTLKTKSCTAIVKRNSKGEVIIGRNQDEEVSKYPVMLFHLTGGKYQAVSFFYSHRGDVENDYSYVDMQKGVEFTEHYRGMMAGIATDAFNEKGLYIQTNMRTNVGVATTETNPGAERVPMIGLSSRVAMNASTVKEAVEYIKTLDVYTLGNNKNNKNATWDYAYLIGDATGEYGIVEFASNKMYYTPYANGHGNAFVSPDLTGLDAYGAGYGRLTIAQRAMVGAETAEDMMEAIHEADWYREVQDFEYSYRDKDGHINFVDKDGKPSIDWRSEFSMLLAVDDFGNLVHEDYTLLQYLDQGCFLLTGLNLAKLLTGRKNPKITPEMKETIDEINALPETLRILGETYTPELQKAVDELNSETSQRYHKNCNKMWLLNDDNFEEVKNGARKFFELQNAFELVDKFLKGDIEPLRAQGTIFTTGMNFGVNCAKKQLLLRVQEDKEGVLEYQWD